MFILWGSSFSCPFCCLEMDRRGYVISFSILFCLYNRSFTVNITYVKCTSLHVCLSIRARKKSKDIYFVYFFCHYKKEKVSVVNKLLYIDFCSAWVSFKCLIFFFYLVLLNIYLSIHLFILLFYLLRSVRRCQLHRYNTTDGCINPAERVEATVNPRGIEFSSEWYRTPLRISPPPNNGI